MKKKILSFLLITYILIFIISCSQNKENEIEPTEAFYINDHANALLSYTQWNIYLNGEELYEKSLELDNISENIKGSQVVVLTYLGQESELDTTEIFNRFEIGKNDMGILIVLFFSMGEEFLEFESITVNIGAQMMTHISSIEIDQLIANHFFDPTWNNSYDLQILILYHEILGLIYTKVYGFQSYTYNSNNFKEKLYDYYGPLPTAAKTSTWVYILFGILIPLFLGITFSVPKFISKKGGGGSSLGYWFNRRK